MLSPGHREQGDRGVAGFRLSEGRHAVAHGLDPGQRGAARRERAQQQDDQGSSGRARIDEAEVGGLGDGSAATQHVPEADAEHDEDAHDEAVGGDGEEGAGLAYPTQVHHHQYDDEQQPEFDAVSAQLGERGDEVLHAGRHRYRDRHHVVDQQGGRRDEGGVPSEVRAADRVGPTPVGVGVAGLSVAQRDQAEQRDHDHRHPGGEQHHGGASEGQNEDDLLRGVGVGRDGVGAVHRQGEALGQQGLVQLGGAHRVADEQPLGHAERGHDSSQRARPSRFHFLDASLTPPVRTLTRP